jgi:hypothetical protein
MAEEKEPSKYESFIGWQFDFWDKKSQLKQALIGIPLGLVVGGIIMFIIFSNIDWEGM